MTLSRYKIWLTLIGWLIIVFLGARSLHGLPKMADIIAILADGISIDRLVIGSMFFVSAMIFRAIRFRLLMTSVATLSTSESLSVFFWAFFLGAISPLRAGEGTRIVWAKEKGIDISKSAIIWLMERATDLWILFLICLFGLLVLNGHITTLTGVALCAPCILMPYLPMLLVNMPRIGHSKMLQSKWGQPIVTTLGQIRQNKIFTKFFLLTILIWCCMILAFTFSYSSVIPELTIAEAALLMGLVNVSFLFAVIPGNIVGYQAAAIFALGLSGINPEVSLTASLLIHAITLSIIFAFGVGGRIGLQVKKHSRRRTS